MDEGRFYRCTWKLVSGRYRVWVRSRPKFAAEGRTFTEADEALWSAILTATGDGEHSREYAPPAPVDADLATFLRPALVMVAGDSHVRVVGRTEYEGATCTTCGYADGRRSEEPLIVPDLESGLDGGTVVIKQPPFASARRHVYSDEFLELLRPAERKRFRWRKVVRPTRAKRLFHELLDAVATIQTIAVKGLPKTGGWRCHTCGYRVFPHYGPWTWPLHWVCASDLPKRLPSCFALSHQHDLALCVIAARWGELAGKRGTRGLLSHEVGVAPPERCDRSPTLRSITSIAREMAARKS